MNEQKISWKRSDLKWRGKQAFKKNYWSAVLVSLVLAIVMATGGSGAATGSAGNAASPDYGVTTYRLGTDINGVTSYVSHVFRSPLAVLFALLSASAVVAVALIGILFHFFVGNVLEVGGRDFYIENLYSVPGPGKLLSVFRSGNYGNIVKTMFLRDLYLVLWTLLFIIPGVVKSYEYKMIPYLLAEYPDMSTKEVFAKSREMMDGQKMIPLSWIFPLFPGLSFRRSRQGSWDSFMYLRIRMQPMRNFMILLRQECRETDSRCMKMKTAVFTDKMILVRGGGDLATGVIHKLHQSGYQILILECDRPSAIRRHVAFCEAVYDGTAEVEGVVCRRVTEDDIRTRCRKCWAQGEIPLLTDTDGKHIRELEPEAVIDAILAKKNLGTSRDMAPLTVGLGPGFTAGEDVDYVIETMRGHNLGRIIKKGSALPNTGVPGLIAGIGKERVIHSPAAGNMKNICKIADLVEKDQVIAMVGDTPVKAAISGVIRGLIRDGYPVFEGMKIADIDPRAEQKKNCFTISDKARCIAGGVLEVLLSCGVLPGKEKAVKNEEL